MQVRFLAFRCGCLSNGLFSRLAVLSKRLARHLVKISSIDKRRKTLVHALAHAHCSLVRALFKMLQLCMLLHALFATSDSCTLSATVCSAPRVFCVQMRKCTHLISMLWWVRYNATLRKTRPEKCHQAKLRLFSKIGNSLLQLASFSRTFACLVWLCKSRKYSFFAQCRFILSAYFAVQCGPEKRHQEKLHTFVYVLECAFLVVMFSFRSSWTDRI